VQVYIHIFQANYVATTWVTHLQVLNYCASVFIPIVDNIVRANDSGSQTKVYHPEHADGFNYGYMQEAQM